MSSNDDSREQRLSCSSSTSSSHEPVNVNQDDEYHDDGLPDLVLTSSTSKCAEEDESSDEDDHVVDLILSLTEGQRSVSVSDLASDMSQDSEYLNDPLEETTVTATPSGASGFRVTYTDHRKSYVSPSKSKPSYASQVGRRKKGWRLNLPPLLLTSSPWLQRAHQ